MRVKSKLIQIPKVKELTTEYIEQELTKLNINPLRWAIVDVSGNMYKVSVADLQE